MDRDLESVIPTATTHPMCFVPGTPNPFIHMNVTSEVEKNKMRHITLPQFLFVSVFQIQLFQLLVILLTPRLNHVYFLIFLNRLYSPDS